MDDVESEEMPGAIVEEFLRRERLESELSGLRDRIDELRRTPVGDE
jgi:hypothetical protein